MAELTKSERDNHDILIRSYVRQEYGTSIFDCRLIGFGNSKGVYRVEIEDAKVLIALGLQREESKSLLADYVILTGLYSSAPEFFPRPISHHAGLSVPVNDESGKDIKQSEILVMECLDMPDLKAFKKANADYSRINRALAYELGNSLGEVNLRTGRYSSEPHDGNILMMVVGGKPVLKFCDAAQFLDGNLEDQVESVLGNQQIQAVGFDCQRRECVSFPTLFRKGLVDAILRITGVSEEEALKSLDFMKKYSPVL